MKKDEFTPMLIDKLEFGSFGVILSEAKNLPIPMLSPKILRYTQNDTGFFILTNSDLSV